MPNQHFRWNPDPGSKYYKLERYSPAKSLWFPSSTYVSFVSAEASAGVSILEEGASIRADICIPSSSPTSNIPTRANPFNEWKYTFLIVFHQRQSPSFPLTSPACQATWSQQFVSPQLKHRIILNVGLLWAFHYPEERRYCWVPCWICEWAFFLFTIIALTTDLVIGS